MFENTNDRFKYTRYTGAQKRIAKWEKRYADDLSKVVFLVTNEVLDSRSPGRRKAYEEWLELHCSICGTYEEVGRQSQGFGESIVVCFSCAESQGV